mgnify:CR=1 FL=1
MLRRCVCQISACRSFVATRVFMTKMTARKSGCGNCSGCTRCGGPTSSPLAAPTGAVDLVTTATAEDDSAQLPSVKRQRCGMTRACPECQKDVALAVEMAFSCAEVRCPACSLIFCGWCSVHVELPSGSAQCACLGQSSDEKTS